MELQPETTLQAAARRAGNPAWVAGSRPAGTPAAGLPWERAQRPVEVNRLTAVPDAEGDEIRVREQFWQTNAAYMVASGKYSLRATAEACGKTYETVRALFRNGWFQEKVALIQRENGAGDLMEVFRSEAASSLVTLVELRDDAKAPASVRRACATDILDRVYGKPTQKVETETTIHSDDPVAEVARLEADNARLRPADGAPPFIPEVQPSLSD